MSRISRQLFADKIAGFLRTTDDDSNKKWAIAAKIGLPALGVAAGGLLLKGRRWKKAYNKASNALSKVTMEADAQKQRFGEELSKAVQEGKEKLKPYIENEQKIRTQMQKLHPEYYEEIMQSSYPTSLPNLVDMVTSHSRAHLRPQGAWTYLSHGPDMSAEGLASAVRTGDAPYALDKAKQILKEYAENVKFYHPYRPGKLGGFAPDLTKKELDNLLSSNQLYDVTRRYAPEYMQYLPKDYVSRVEDWYKKNKLSFDSLDRTAETVKSLFGEAPKA